MSLRKHWGAWIGAIATFLLATAIVRSVLSGPMTVADDKDRRHAERDASGAGPSPSALVAGNGRVEPAGREIRVSSSVPGRVASWKVKEGDRVAAGQVLLELEVTTELAELRAAEADLDLAKAELARAIRGPRSEEIAAAVADAESASARARLAQRDLGRSKQLAADGAIAAEMLDRATLEAEAQDATVRSAQARAQAIKAGTRQEDIRAASARAAAAAARVEQARAALDRLSIRSPLDGEVLQQSLRAGEYFDPRSQQQLAIVGDTSHLRVRMEVDERDVGRVQVGASAHATADAFPGVRFNGRVLEVGRRLGPKSIRTDDPTETNDTRVLEVVIALDKTDGLLPGMRVIGYVHAGLPSS